MSLSSLISILNTATNGLLGVGFLIILWLIVYMRRRHITPTREAIVGASWATLVVSFPLRYLELINDWVFGVTIIISLAAIVMIINRE